MEWLQDFTDSIGRQGALIFILVYLVFQTLPLPSGPLTLAAGFLFGFVEGLAIALGVTLVGSMTGFTISRYLLRHEVQRIVKRHPKLKAVEGALREGGWRAVALLQLSPAVPFGLQNYFFGATKVRFRPYIIGTAAATIPASTTYVALGATGRSAQIEGPMKWALLAVGIVATILLSVWIGRMAKRRLKLA